MLRKIIITISAVSAVLLLFCFNFASAAEYKTGEYIVSESRVGVYSTPDSSGVLICELYGGTNAAVVTVTEIKNGSGCVFISSEQQSGWVEMAALTYLGSEATITGIAVTPPEKLTYIDGEESFDSTGLKVFALAKNGTKTEITGYELFVPPLIGTGTKTAVVYYTPSGETTTYSAKFTVTVVKVPVSSLSVTSMPDKLSYIENEALSLDGLKLTAHYSDSRADRVFTLSQILSDSSFIISSCHGEELGKALTIGTHTLRITYKYSDIYTDIPFNVRARELVSLNIAEIPSNIAYYEGEGLVLQGLKLNAEYDNGDTQEVPLSSCSVVFDEQSAVIGGKSTVTVKYLTGSTSFQVDIKTSTLVGVKLTPPSKVTYKPGEKMDTAGLVLTGIYNSGTQKALTDYTLSETDMSVVGSHTIIVSCGEYSARFTITVTQSRLSGDADADGSVSAADARLVLRFAVNLEKPTDNEQFAACDIDNDKAITAADARLVLRAAVGLEKLN